VVLVNDGRDAGRRGLGAVSLDAERARLDHAGVRVEHWQLFDQTKASPWLLTEFEVRSGTRVRFGAGVQHQSATLDNAIFTLPDQDLVPERAATIEAGIEQRIGSAWRLNLSAYHRRDDDGCALVILNSASRTIA
jgi:hypothetical protein